MHTLGKDARLGILGGGQLGRMLIQKAIDWNIPVQVLDPDRQAPCSVIADWFVAKPFNEFDPVVEFGRSCTHLTIEIEHVNVPALYQLESEGIRIVPQPRVLQIVQDKGMQKDFFTENKIDTAAYFRVSGREELQSSKLTYPFVLKQCRQGYDGRGVMVIQSAAELSQAFDAPAVVEEKVEIEKELSVIAVRNDEGHTAFFPVVEMVFNARANLVEYLLSPARIEPDVERKAIELARKVVNSFSLTGIMAVEMFLTSEGRLLVNEVAPRPHNSGHHTIEANVTSQYEQLLRTLFNFPLGSTGIVSPAVMLNLLGEDGHEGPAFYSGLEEALAVPGVYVHLYGKKTTRPFRKMGHVTVMAVNIQQALEKAQFIRSKLKVIS